MEKMLHPQCNVKYLKLRENGSLKFSFLNPLCIGNDETVFWFTPTITLHGTVYIDTYFLRRDLLFRRVISYFHAIPPLMTIFMEGSRGSLHGSGTLLFPISLKDLTSFSF